MSADRKQRDESDQLPEEAPSRQTVEDEGKSGARDEAKDQSGGADRDADSDASTGGAGAGD